jgi:HSP20 family molecular chaperone IbpA
LLGAPKGQVKHNSLNKGENNMTNTTQLVPGHYASTERVINQLPALFSSRWFNSIFDDSYPEKLIEDSQAFYPYNLSVVKEGEDVKQYILEIALAGVGKNNIAVDVKSDILTINVTKDDLQVENKNESTTYLKRGISRRKSTFSYKIDTNQIDVKKIQSTYIDGLLTVTVPVKKKETHKVDIKVNID